ncbi:ATP-dependent RNA helicase-like [Raphidocelis subcapitata]|uniref:RNA helicase n=1 Tax=Raphidocelis subcapitata TaxID=307507 RepID=A0A2V0P917_9CHLO|nr:ATP-dependent RNA helicase-like [Raphidocelis subcapitata]|eukprot:GBF96354.1 ATP-dependent RNA helicase-like [Raphidocelis subcapitata]
MGGYVPPHLRNKTGAGAGDAGSAPPPPRSSSFGDLRSRDGGGGSRGGWGDDRGSGGGGGGGGSFARRADGPAPRAGRGPIEATFAPYDPSDRVKALNEDQIADIKQRLNVMVEVPEGEPEAAAPVESFRDMNLHENILADITAHKYETPTPIQAQGIPVALSGRDILGCAETGSGKTASFAIPMIQFCLNQPPLRPGDGPMGLVLAPTRELAQQIDKEVAAFGQSSRRSVRTCIVVGGVQMHEQRHELRAGVEVVVATPGRFIDHLQQGNTNLARVGYVVLDEADRMLDMGFEPQIREVLQNLPPRHQTLLFSATMPPEIEGLASQYLVKPIKVKVGKVSVPTANVSQTLERAEERQKPELLVALLQEEMDVATRGGPEMPLTIVFVERKTRCDEVVQLLQGENIPAASLHGGLSQWERETSLKDFSEGRARVLVATDVASRGLDVKGIGHVINMDLPRAFEDYVHRIGRTGRAGTRGRATSFFSDRDAFLVSQIKTALAELERGNTAAFQMGKEARRQEKELAAKFRSDLKLGTGGVIATESGTAAVKVDAKYAHMAAATLAASKAGAADAAWDD